MCIPFSGESACVNNLQPDGAPALFRGDPKRSPEQHTKSRHQENYRKVNCFKQPPFFWRGNLRFPLYFVIWNGHSSVLKPCLLMLKSPKLSFVSICFCCAPNIPAASRSHVHLSNHAIHPNTDVKDDDMVGLCAIDRTIACEGWSARPIHWMWSNHGVATSPLSGLGTKLH